eukprot:scaffold4908_cov109-Isochrysis_galbana.AAC.4
MEVAPVRAETIRAVRPSRSWLLSPALARRSSSTMPSCCEKQAVASAVHPLPSRTLALAPAWSSWTASASSPADAADMSIVPPSSSSTALTSPPESRYSCTAVRSPLRTASSSRAGSRGRESGGAGGAEAGLAGGAAAPIGGRAGLGWSIGRGGRAAAGRAAAGRANPEAGAAASPPPALGPTGRLVRAWPSGASLAVSLDPRDVSSLEEHHHARDQVVALNRRVVVGSEAAVVAGVQPGLRGQQQVHYPVVPRHGRVHQRCHALRLLELRVGAMRQRQLHSLRAGGGRRNHEQRPALAVAGIRVATSREPLPDRTDLARLDRTAHLLRQRRDEAAGRRLGRRGGRGQHRRLSSPRLLRRVRARRVDVPIVVPLPQVSASRRPGRRRRLRLGSHRMLRDPGRNIYTPCSFF